MQIFLQIAPHKRLQSEASKVPSYPLTRVSGIKVKVSKDNKAFDCMDDLASFVHWRNGDCIVWKSK